MSLGIFDATLHTRRGRTPIRAQAEGLALQAGFDFGRECFEMRLEDARLTTRAVKTPSAPFVLQASGNAMAIVVYGTVPLDQLQQGGVVGVEGDLVAAQCFVDLFMLG